MRHHRHEAEALLRRDALVAQILEHRFLREALAACVDVGKNGSAGGDASDAGCTVACSTNHVTPTCVGSTCSGVCDTGYADCNHDLKSDGYEVAIGADPLNCGACGRICSTSHVTAACSAGACDGACDPGFSDCNGDKQRDGCEVPTGTDPRNCGSCGAALFPLPDHDDVLGRHV